MEAFGKTNGWRLSKAKQLAKLTQPLAFSTFLPFPSFLLYISIDVVIVVATSSICVVTINTVIAFNVTPTVGPKFVAASFSCLLRLWTLF